MSKTYISQKDLPDCDAGTEFIHDGKSSYDYVGKNKVPGYYDEDTIQNNPDWFKPKEENKSNDSFQWTDELVERAILWRLQYNEYLPMSMMKDEFKTNPSPTPKPQAENKPDRDWEILEYLFVPLSGMARYATVNRDSKYWERAASGDEEFTIHSVKRLSDGEVFSVGDEVEWGVEGYRASFKITRFFVDEEAVSWTQENNGLFFDTDGKEHNQHIGFSSASNLQKKLPPQPQKEEQRIEVVVMNNGFGGEIMTVRPKASEWKIPKEKNEAIKQAIEQVLNDDKGIKQWEDKFYWMGKELIPLEKVDAMCEDAFNAARQIDVIQWNEEDVVKTFVHKNFQDYKNSKQ